MYKCMTKDIPLSSFCFRSISLSLMSRCRNVIQVTTKRVLATYWFFSKPVKLEAYHCQLL